MIQPDPTEKILVIDDEAVIRMSFTYYLEDQDYNVINAENGKAGMEILDRDHPSLVITDLRMPEADGLEVLQHVKEHHPEVPVIVISGANRLDDAVQALRLGAWDYLIKPVQDLSLLGYTVQKALEKAHLLKENRTYREHLEILVAERTEELERRNRELEVSRRQILGVLSQAAEYRDFETGNHFLRVSEFTGCLAEGMGWDDERIHRIRLASPVHDIGKIGIPDYILLKQDNLNDEEWEKMKEHSRYGQMILTSNKYIDSFIKIDNLLLPHESEDPEEIKPSIVETAADIALNHHEFWDGGGYPAGLKGEEISVEARITAVADVFDALSSDRPYKAPWPEEKSLAYIKDQAGKQFDPQIVQVFLDRIDTIRAIQNRYKD